MTLETDSGAAQDETPSPGADEVEDDAGTPPEEVDDDADDDSDETPSDDDGSEGDDDDSADDEEGEGDEDAGDTFDREAFLAKLTPAEKRAFLKQENDAKRFGRTAKQAAILAREVKALKANRPAEKAPEEKPDPQVEEIDREFKARVTEIKPVYETWQAKYKEWEEAAQEESRLRARVEATQDEYEKGNLESRLYSARALRQSLHTESERLREKFQAIDGRIKYLQAVRPEVEAKSKEARERQRQLEEEQAQQVARFPTKVTKFIDVEAKTAGIPIPAAEKERVAAFRRAVMSLVGDQLIERYESGKPMASDPLVRKFVAGAIATQARIMGIKPRGKASAAPAAQPQQVRRVAPVAKPASPASASGASPERNPDYQKWQAEQAKREAAARRAGRLAGLL